MKEFCSFFVLFIAVFIFFAKNSYSACTLGDAVIDVNGNAVVTLENCDSELTDNDGILDALISGSEAEYSGNSTFSIIGAKLGSIIPGIDGTNNPDKVHLVEITNSVISIGDLDSNSIPENADNSQLKIIDSDVIFMKVNDVAGRLKVGVLTLEGDSTLSIDSTLENEIIYINDASSNASSIDLVGATSSLAVTRGNYKGTIDVLEGATFEARNIQENDGLRINNLILQDSIFKKTGLGETIIINASLSGDFSIFVEEGSLFMSDIGDHNDNEAYEVQVLENANFTFESGNFAAHTLGTINYVGSSTIEDSYLLLLNRYAHGSLIVETDGLNIDGVYSDSGLNMLRVNDGVTLDVDSDFIYINSFFLGTGANVNIGDVNNITSFILDGDADIQGVITNRNGYLAVVSGIVSKDQDPIIIPKYVVEEIEGVEVQALEIVSRDVVLKEVDFGSGGDDNVFDVRLFNSNLEIQDEIGSYSLDNTSLKLFGDSTFKFYSGVFAAEALGNAVIEYLGDDSNSTLSINKNLSSPTGELIMGGSSDSVLTIQNSKVGVILANSGTLSLQGDILANQIISDQGGSATIINESNTVIDPEISIINGTLTMDNIGDLSNVVTIGSSGDNAELIYSIGNFSAIIGEKGVLTYKGDGSSSLKLNSEVRSQQGTLNIDGSGEVTLQDSSIYTLNLLQGSIVLKEGVTINNYNVKEQGVLNLGSNQSISNFFAEGTVEVLDSIVITAEASSYNNENNVSINNLVLNNGSEFKNISGISTIEQSDFRDAFLVTVDTGLLLINNIGDHSANESGYTITVGNNGIAYTDIAELRFNSGSFNANVISNGKISYTGSQDTSLSLNSQGNQQGSFELLGSGTVTLIDSNLENVDIASGIARLENSNLKNINIVDSGVVTLMDSISENIDIVSGQLVLQETSGDNTITNISNISGKLDIYAGTVGTLNVSGGENNLLGGSLERSLTISNSAVVHLGGLIDNTYGITSGSYDITFSENGGSLVYVYDTDMSLGNIISTFNKESKSSSILDITSLNSSSLSAGEVDISELIIREGFLLVNALTVREKLSLFVNTDNVVSGETYTPVITSLGNANLSGVLDVNFTDTSGAQLDVNDQIALVEANSIALPETYDLVFNVDLFEYGYDVIDNGASEILLISFVRDKTYADILREHEASSLHIAMGTLFDDLLKNNSINEDMSKTINKDMSKIITALDTKTENTEDLIKALTELQPISIRAYANNIHSTNLRMLENVHIELEDFRNDDVLNNFWSDFSFSLSSLDNSKDVVGYDARSGNLQMGYSQRFDTTILGAALGYSIGQMKGNNGNYEADFNNINLLFSLGYLILNDIYTKTSIGYSYTRFDTDRNISFFDDNNIIYPEYISNASSIMGRAEVGYNNLFTNGININYNLFYSIETILLDSYKENGLAMLLVEDDNIITNDIGLNFRVDKLFENGNTNTSWNPFISVSGGLRHYSQANTDFKFLGLDNEYNDFTMNDGSFLPIFVSSTYGISYNRSNFTISGEYKIDTDTQKYFDNTIFVSVGYVF